MSLLRPSLTLVLDIDERLASPETILEIKRCYPYVGTPVIRTHTPASQEAPFSNKARMMVGLGTRRYLHSTDEGADDLWNDVVERWIGNMLYKVSSTMRSFNTRQRKIGLPELAFERIDVELQGGELVASLHPDPQSFIDFDANALVSHMRALFNNGTLKNAVRVEIPSEESWQAQFQKEHDNWITEHPEAKTGEQARASKEADANPSASSNASASTGQAGAHTGEKADRELTREEWLEADKQAKSYENTAVPPTDSNELPPIEREEEAPEPEQFTFNVDYSLWSVLFADGTSQSFDTASNTFADAIQQA